MSRSVALIGAPSSAGAYAPGQEKAPKAVREHGLVHALEKQGLRVIDYGDTEYFRWRADRSHPEAMNVRQAVRTARSVASRVQEAIASNHFALVIGGDCTVEIGTLAGAQSTCENVGLLYIDFDADMNTPLSTTDGALDWMGVAHMLSLPGTVGSLASIRSDQPMLEPANLMLFGVGNIKESESSWIDDLKIQLVDFRDVYSDPETSTQRALDWGRTFDRLLIHLDVDIIDFEKFPIAENTRRKTGLSFEAVVSILKRLLQARNVAALTVCEVNPDHGEEHGTTMTRFVVDLGDALASIVTDIQRQPGQASTQATAIDRRVRASAEN